jgi:hypothetical protein
MFATYRMQNRERAKTVAFGGWSYVWAGIFGGFYLIFKVGRRSLLPALLFLIAYGAAVGGLVFTAVSFVPQPQQPIALVVGTIAIVVVQSLRICKQVKRSYRRRGWTVRRED